MSGPALSVCEFTTPDTTFEEDLELAAAVGATGIGICEFKLREGEEERQLEAFRRSGLEAAVCMPVNISPLPASRIFPGPEDLDERLELMRRSVLRLAPFEPASIIVLTGSGAGRRPEEARRAVVEALRELAAVAAEAGTRLGLEPQRVDLVPGRSLVATLGEAVELVDEVGAPNLEVVYDVFHLWDTPDALAEARRYARRLAGVQVCDWRAETRGPMDRALPGDGVVDLPALFAALRAGGFDGWYDLEVFSDDGRYGNDYEDSLWKLPPRELVERGVAGFRRAWEATREESS